MATEQTNIDKWRAWEKRTRKSEVFGYMKQDFYGTSTTGWQLCLGDYFKQNPISEWLAHQHLPTVRHLVELLPWTYREKTPTRAIVQAYLRLGTHAKPQQVLDYLQDWYKKEMWWQKAPNRKNLLQFRSSRYFALIEAVRTMGEGIPYEEELIARTKFHSLFGFPEGLRAVATISIQPRWRNVSKKKRSRSENAS